MNDRTIKFSATLGAVALALGVPAIASAQDQANPGMTMPAYSAAPAPMMSQSDQLDRVQSLGFLNSSEVLTTRVDPNVPNNFGPLPSDQLHATLENVKVESPDGITYTLRGYLDSQGITPSSIVSMSVNGNSVIVAHT